MVFFSTLTYLRRYVGVFSVFFMVCRPYNVPYKVRYIQLAVELAVDLITYLIRSTDSL